MFPQIAEPMSRLLPVLVLTAVVEAWPHLASAQVGAPRFEAGVQVPATMSSQFDQNEIGVGGRFSWHPDRWLGVESEVVLYPRAFPDGVAFSRRRVEGLFGVTLGPEFGRVRPFAKLRSGFVNIQKAPKPFACILIFPPPLSCRLASGDTLLAFDIGGGIELFLSPRTFVRIEAGDRPLRYPGPVFDNSRTRRDGAFFSHDFRFAAGAGLRF